MENLGQSFSENGFSPNDDEGVVFVEDTPVEGVVDDHNVADDTQDTAPRKKKNANPFNKRIDRLTAEKGEAEQQANFWAQQTAERDRVIAAQQEQLLEAQQKAQQSDKYANSYYESNLQTAESALIDKIEQAELEGDIRRKTELSRDLAKVVAQQSTYELYKSQREQQQREQLYNEPYVPYETQVAPEPYRRPAPVNEDFRDWQEENSWYGTDQGLTREADQLADELARTLRFNNQSHLIGTNEFRQTITDEMRKRYGSTASSQESDQQEQSYPQSRVAAVAPVTRRGTSMADQYVNNGRGGSRMAPLTKEEYALAKYLPQKTKTESEADLMRRYAEGKKYPKSPHSGGTPYRLTIL